MSGILFASREKRKERIWVLNSQLATAPGWCIIATVALPRIWGCYKRHKVTQFYSEIKSVRTGKKNPKTSETIAVWKLDIRLQAEYPLTPSLPLTLMLQPVSGLIKSKTNTNKCLHLKAAHSTFLFLHDMWSLNLIETQCARRPRIHLLGWRFNQIVRHREQRWPLAFRIHAGN